MSGIGDWLENIFEDLGPKVEDAGIRPPWIRSGDVPPQWDDFRDLPGDAHRKWCYASSDWSAEKDKKRLEQMERERAAEEAKREQEYLNWCDEQNAAYRRAENQAVREERQSVVNALWVFGVIAVIVGVVVVLFLVARSKVAVARPPAMQQELVDPAVLQGVGSLVWSDATPAGLAWETTYQGVKVRVAIVGPNMATYAIFWSNEAAGHPATFGASAKTLEEAKALASYYTIQEWDSLPAMLGWE